jgi:hypothetical protein
VAPSRLHWNFEPDSEETKVKVAEVLLTGPDGPLVTVVFGYRAAAQLF